LLVEPQLCLGYGQARASRLFRVVLVVHANGEVLARLRKWGFQVDIVQSVPPGPLRESSFNPLAQIAPRGQNRADGSWCTRNQITQVKTFVPAPHTTGGAPVLGKSCELHDLVLMQLRSSLVGRGCARVLAP